MKPDIADQPSAADTAQQGRRQLLKMVAYVPPAMLGVMISASKIAEAAATPGSTKNCGGGTIIVISSNGTACCPCVPTSNQYNVNTCNLNKCQLGNCTACTQVAFTSTRQCRQSVPVNCACTCTPLNPRRRRGPATCI